MNMRTVLLKRYKRHKSTMKQEVHSTTTSPVSFLLYVSLTHTSRLLAAQAPSLGSPLPLSHSSSHVPSLLPRLGCSGSGPPLSALKALRLRTPRQHAYSYTTAALASCSHALARGSPARTTRLLHRSHALSAHTRGNVCPPCSTARAPPAAIRTVHPSQRELIAPDFPLLDGRRHPVAYQAVSHRTQRVTQRVQRCEWCARPPRP